ncbi:MAG: Monosaccharide transporter substrate-binding protein family [Modestobacter sp.]|jgi:protein TorT|nr:Monosaccharide transporter substrate-binding protein family [Modestobacter sp.]
MRTMRMKAVALTALATVGVVFLSGCGAAGKDQPAGASAPAASDDWSISADFTQRDGTREVADYKPLATSEVTKAWKVCALLPHVKDALWVSANYGNLMEAQREGVQYNMFEAGGYGNLSTQVSQMDDCIVQKYDAIILGAISADGDCASIERALQAGIAVVDFINGTSCSAAVTSNPLFSQAVVSYYDTAAMAAKYLVDSSAGAPRKVGVFPGPDGATFANDAAAGFADTTKGTSVDTAVVRRGDTGMDVQLSLIQDALQAYPDMTDLFGVDIAAEAATVALRNANKTGNLHVYGYTIIPQLYEAIKAGDADGAVADHTPFQGRIAVDLAVRMLEGKTLQAPRVGPVPLMVTSKNVNDVDYVGLFGPRDFQPVYKWAP